jgi:RNA polymerase sigma-70 factor (ECF subfamily)
MHTPALNERQQKTDAECVRRCLGGDRGAFQPLAERYYRPICAYLLKRVPQPDVVEDLAQETFLEAYRSLKSIGRPEQFASWLFGIARNRSGKWLRRPRLALFSATDSPELAAAPSSVAALEELEEQEKRLAELESGLADLPEEARRLLDLKHRQGKTCEAIAREVGRPVGTVKSLLSRAYKTLRGRLSRPGGEEA